MDRFNPQYYYNVAGYQPGFVLLQYYNGANCDGPLTLNYGYRNGACVPYGATGSLRVVFENGDCGSTVAIYFSDTTCQIAVEYYQLGDLTICATNATLANSYLWSSNLNCVLGETLPVTMDSILYSYRPTSNCSAPITAFQSVANNICLAAPLAGESFELTCAANGATYEETTYTTSTTCTSGGVTLPFTATCPAVGEGYGNRRLEELKEAVASIDNEDKDPQGLIALALSQMTFPSILAQKKELRLEDQWLHPSQSLEVETGSLVEAQGIHNGGSSGRMHTDIVYFTCPAYSASNTNSATRSYVTCTMTVPSAGSYYVTTCPTYGGAFTGLSFHDELLCSSILLNFTFLLL